MNHDWIVVFAHYKYQSTGWYVLNSIQSKDSSSFLNDSELNCSCKSFYESLVSEDSYDVVLIFYSDDLIPCAFFGNPEEQDHDYSSYVFVRNQN